VLNRRVIPASWGGKAKTVSQAIALGFWLTPAWVIVGEWILYLNWVLMIAAVVLTVISGVEYLVKGLSKGGLDAQ
jgi:CDP-diacylglycerol--glycerol-3-phosphate 3-phosphatidyltransferase